MYKKAISGLILMSLLFLFGTICVDGAALEKQLAIKTLDLKLEKEGMSLEAESESAEGAVTVAHAIGIIDTAISDQRILELQRVELTGNTTVGSKEDYELLLRIVEAEAGNQDAEGRLLVANVVLNRVASEKFPDNVRDVILQGENGTYQFSPVANGRIWRVQISEETKRAVERAMQGEDISEGALYFAARQYADQSSMKWFDNHLTYLFEWGDHEFFK